MLKRQTPPITLHGFDVTDPIRNLVDYGYYHVQHDLRHQPVALTRRSGLEHRSHWDICNHTVSAVGA